VVGPALDAGIYNRPPATKSTPGRSQVRNNINRPKTHPY
jgi:hypothetical protein